MNDSLARARSLYQRQNYRLGLEILESRLHEWETLRSPERFQVFDLLAALSEKQGLLTKAQTYAVKTVKADVRDLRGYLRLGKILQALNKPDQALRIYERAVTKAQFASDDQRNFVDRQMKVCRQRTLTTSTTPAHLASPLASVAMSRRDPLYELSTDILLQIFSRMSTSELLKCCGVSKIWRSFLESQPALWLKLKFDVPDPAVPSISLLTPRTRTPRVIGPAVVSRCLGLAKRGRLSIDLRQVLVAAPEQLFDTLSRLSERIETLELDHVAAVTPIPTLRLMRHASAEWPVLTRLRIASDCPDRDLRWCLTMLPALEELDIATRPHATAAPPTAAADAAMLKVACPQLATLRMLGGSAQAVVAESTIHQALSQLEHLTTLELHRVVAQFWPALHAAFASERLEKFGFTAAITTGGDPVTVGNTALGVGSVPLPLPNANSRVLTAFTLNDVRVLRRLQAVALPDISWFRGAFGAQTQLKYLELKRVTLHDTTPPALLADWGATDSIETLVLHAVHSGGPDGTPVHTGQWPSTALPRLATLQYTNMGTLDERAVAWIRTNCPKLRKLNLDGTNVTGPQLVTLFTDLPHLVALRCKSLSEVGADTIAWLNSLEGKTIVF